ncbi:MAG TPA: DUF308 domain-containing protein [Caulobacteraceae bacterium]|jgi:uncharacterized membrane protein HdeD (DUF308 family)|nr:DUF308 domain-containing protein [Caulobacteraceae bacterium]
MKSPTTHPSAAPLAAPIKISGSSWWILTIEGLILIALGLAAGVAPFVASLTVTVLVGWLYMIVGVVRAASSITHRNPGFGWSLFGGCLALIVGGFLLWRPLTGAVSLMILLGAYFAVDGLLSFFLAATTRRHTGRAAMSVVTGVVDLALAVVVFLGLVHGAIWLLGLVVAVNLVFAGATLVTMSIAWRATHRNASSR